MSTEELTLTLSRARSYGRAMLSWGFSNVQVVENLATGDRYVTAENRAGMRRVVRSAEEFNQLRDMEG